MFERAEVRRTGRAVSFTLAVLAHALLLVAVLVLVRKQPEVEKPIIIVDVGRWRDPQKPRGPKGDSTRDQTHGTRHRPQPRPVEIAEVRPPPASQPDPPFEEPVASGIGEGTEGSAGPGPGPVTGIGDCIGPGCGVNVGPAPAEILDIGQPGIVRPQALCNPAAPTMQEQARVMGITGAVVMRYVVETDGSVSRMELRNGDAAPVLVEAVRTWLEHCRFRPGIARGQEARIQVERPFVFKLR